MDTMQTVLEIENAPAIPHEVCLLCSALETGAHSAGPAPKNLLVPSYKFTSDTKIKIG